MPRKCVGTLSGEPCCFGIDKQPALPSVGARCSFCKPKEDLGSLSRTSWAAIARVAATLTAHQQALLLDRLTDVPNLKSMVEAAIVKKCGQLPVTESEERAEIHTRHESAPCQEMKISDMPSKHHQRITLLDQGSFGLCSEFSLATCAAHSLQCKYGLFLSDETLLDKWHSNTIPPKAMWPDECASFLGEFRRQWPFTIHTMSLTLHPAQHWKHFCHMVHAFAGFRCAIVVASIGPPGDRGNHSMSAIHWNQCDGKVVCQNSWGCNLNPFIEIHSSDFVRGWVVEVVISSTVVPKDGKQQKIAPPPAKPEWQRLLASIRQS